MVRPCPQLASSLLPPFCLRDLQSYLLKQLPKTDQQHPLPRILIRRPRITRDIQTRNTNPTRRSRDLNTILQHNTRRLLLPILRRSLIAHRIHARSTIPPFTFIISSTLSTLPKSTATHPIFSAAFNRSGTLSTTKTLLAPLRMALYAAISPTGPAPNTAMDSSGLESRKRRRRASR
jgi:hypothetical protein